MNRSWHWQLRHFRKKNNLLNVQNDTGNTISNPISTPMDPTTLVTFLFKAPPEARTIELLGSWDNFSQPYRMHHDRRRGKGYWSGCFRFQNIIFDGDNSKWTKPRTGGLKQGGTYWYFYRLDDEYEVYDDSQTYTTSCPLLPGQGMNVIEVPIEVQEPPTRCRSASMDVADSIAQSASTQTLDPGDKFAALDPPPVSKVHIRCVSDLALNGRLENKPHSNQDLDQSLPPSPPYSDQQSPNPRELPSRGRYYTKNGHSQDDLSDRASSVDSRRSWQSEAPSVAHSSIYDAYGTECNLKSNPTSGHSNPVHYEEDVPLEFATQKDDSARTFYEDTNSEQVDLGNVNSAPGSRRGAHSPPNARPTTSHGNIAWRMNLWSNEPSPNDDSQSEEAADAEPADMLSPTFSAATLSSSGGVNTPYRLSIGCSRTASVSAPERLDSYHGASLESVADRLRSLSSRGGTSYSNDDDDDEPAFISASIYEQHTHLAPRRFAGYALPDSDAAQSVQSLGKLSSRTTLAPTNDEVPPLPSSLILSPSNNNNSSSLVDDIFSELGYLGGSIA